MSRFSFASWLAVVGALAAGAGASAQEQLAIKGGRILPVGKPPIEGGVILIRDGKIQAVGKDLPVPADYKVIDAAGKVVMPGFIDAHSSRGMDQANERNSNVPFLSVVDAIDPGQEYFEDCLRNGVTTVAIVPAEATMIGGQGAVIKTAGSYVDQMIVKRHAGIKISLRPTEGRSRMSHLASLRKELDGARDALEDQLSRPKAAAAAPARKPAKPAPPAAPPAESDGEKVTAEPTQPEPPAGGEGAEGATQRPDDATARRAA